MSHEEVVLNKVYTATMKQTKGAGSKRLPADPFGRLYGEYGLVRPPYNFAKLMAIKESHPVHCACIEAKADDIAGQGWHWVAVNEKDNPDTTLRDQVQAFLENCNPEVTFQEILRAMWEDYETLKWCIMEVVFDGQGLPCGFYHVPAQTVRAHADGKRFAQLIDGKTRWFKRVGDPDDYDMDSGDKREGLNDDRKAGTLLVLKKPGGRSDYYGIPEYISALGAIIGSQAARDFNIDWFSGRTVPDTVLIVEGADVEESVRENLQAFFSGVGVTRSNHKLAILPIPAAAASQGVKAKFEKLTPDLKDASFRLYRQDNNLEICIAHRVPPYRIGWPVTGSLGGNASEQMDEFYKSSVIGPSQLMIEHRINSKLLSLFGELKWRWELNQVDLTDDSKDLDYAIKGVTNGLLNPDEGRAHIGKDPYPDDMADLGKKFYMPTSVVEAGTKPESPPSGLQEAQNGSKAIPPKGILQDGVKKSTEGENESAQIYWADWVGVHHSQEIKLQERVADFFPGRQAE